MINNRYPSLIMASAVFSQRTVVKNQKDNKNR